MPDRILLEATFTATAEVTPAEPSTTESADPGEDKE